jgi:uncharacterized glyoxalase superfamily protein PhnB
MHVIAISLCHFLLLLFQLDGWHHAALINVNCKVDHAILMCCGDTDFKLGDSHVMCCDKVGDHITVSPQLPYVYVEDVDATFKSAKCAGAALRYV